MKRKAIGKQFISVAALVLGCFASVAHASDYPNKTIRVVVPFPPGGTVDIIGRTIANELSKRLNTTVVVENKAGAGGTIGANDVAKAPADGYTLLIAATHHSINPSLRSNLPYDSLNDLRPIARIITTPSVLVVGKDTPFMSVGDLIQEGRREGSQLNYGSTGTGGVNHLAGELFKSMAGVRMSHIPYKGAAPAMTDLLGGQIPIMFDSPPTVVQQVNAGRIRALAVSGGTRSPLLPNVPTFEEAGLAGFRAEGWVGLIGPGALPNEIVSKLSSAVMGYVRTEEARDKFAALGVEAAPLNHNEFDKFFRGEISKWKKVIDTAGIRIE